jgi:transcriptional regulator with XRE-family HTH domain
MTDEPLSILGLRKELGLTLQDFSAEIGLGSRGRASEIERGGPVSVAVALRIEKLSDGRIAADRLNKDVAAARAGCECVHNPDTAQAPASVTAGNSHDLTPLPDGPCAGLPS